MALQLPDNLRDKALQFPESSQGANCVTLILSDSRKIRNVFIAWGTEIIKIGNRMIASENDLQFKLLEIIDIESEILKIGRIK